MRACAARPCWCRPEWPRRGGRPLRGRARPSLGWARVEIETDHGVSSELWTHDVAADRTARLQRPPGQARNSRSWGQDKTLAIGTPRRCADCARNWPGLVCAPPRLARQAKQSGQPPDLVQDHPRARREAQGRPRGARSPAAAGAGPKALARLPDDRVLAEMTSGCSRPASPGASSRRNGRASRRPSSASSRPASPSSRTSSGTR